jgi:alginate O-acetyltransferase complex protein AlgI
MPFVSPLFLFIFLPLFFAVYYCAPSRLKNLVGALASLAFYAWGAPRFAPILIATSCLDFWLSRQMVRRPERSKVLLSFSLVLNLSLLFYFKYINFFMAQLISVGLPFDSANWSSALLPLGISFFTFHKLSYLIDVYRRDVPPAESLVDFLLYILLFPQLIAGPIVRYHEIAPQLKSRRADPASIEAGIKLFCVGLGKKALIADYVSTIADTAFAQGFTPGPLGAWVGTLAYAIQIYFDFSGYSDMARGLAEMMGFVFPLNFNQPYRAESITDFWRRWHMTLSAWMKNYLYIPLGGNRVGQIRSALNLWIVFLLSGLWHGAQWTFVGWGAFHGFFLSLDKLFLLEATRRLPLPLRQLLTFVLVCLGWVLFRAENFSQAMSFYSQMFSPQLFELGAEQLVRFSDISTRAWWMLGAGVVFAYWRSPRLLDSWLVALGLYMFSVISLINASFSPFIYFRF